MANLIIYLKDGTTRTAETDILNYLEGDTRQPANRLLWLDADTQQKQVVRIEDIKRFTVDVSGEGEAEMLRKEWTTAEISASASSMLGALLDQISINPAFDHYTPEDVADAVLFAVRREAIAKYVELVRVGNAPNGDIES